MSTTIEKETLKKVLLDVIAELGTPSAPIKKWWTLSEACERKGISYKTACNKTHLQPMHGVADGRIGGRKKWRWETILKWLELTDDLIEKEPQK